MKMRTALALAAVLALPLFAAAEAPAHGQPVATETAAAAPANAGAAAPAAPPDMAPEPLFLDSGCFAEQICIHQPPPTVSCSGPPGATCSSSWGGCGQVTCNGVTTRCPGYCVGDHHCFNFCMNTYGSFEGTCNTGCCDCA